MPDSNVPVTGGSGYNIDARTNAGGDYRQVIIIGDQTANDAIAVVTSSDAGVQTSEYGMVTRPLMTDAAKLRVSSIVSDAGNFLVSSKSGDAGQFLVSAKQGDAGLLHVSAFVDSGSVSAKQGDAGNLRISGIQGDGANLRVSAAQTDAGLLHVSASLFPDTTGGLTAFMSLSVSSAQSVKGSAGSLYGYYAFNKDTKIAFLKLYNLSSGLTVGTDVPVVTIPLPISGGANAWFGNGIAGFTAGIQMAATSGLAVDNTAAPAASAVTVNLFYK